MARQVRPWLAKPEIFEAHKVRPTDRGVNQRIPSGTAAQAASKVRMYGCNLYLFSRHELSAWHRGRPCTEIDPRWVRFRSGAPGDRQGAKGASPSQQRYSEPCCPRVMRVASRGATRSVDRGTCRPAIEPRKKFDPGADVVRSTEGNMHGRVIASARATRRGRRPWHARTLLVREPGDLQSDRRRQSWPAARIGKVRSRRR